MRRQESYWSFKTPPIPELRDLPAGTFAGNVKQWDSLSPGMRREIHRQANKINLTVILPDGRIFRLT